MRRPSPKPAIPVGDRVDPGRSFLIHLSLNFIPTAGYAPWQSGEVDILGAFQMQHLPDLRGGGDLKGEFFKDAADLPHLFGVTRRLHAGGEIQIVFQSHADICAEDGSHGQKGHLVASRAQHRKLISLASEQAVRRRSHEEEVFGVGTKAAQDTENSLNKERRLDDVAVDEPGEVVKVPDVVALEFEPRAAFSK